MGKVSNNSRCLLLSTVACLSVIGFARPASAFEYTFDNGVVIHFDNKIQYSLAVRASPVNSYLGGQTGPAQNTNDGDNNLAAGVISNRIDVLSKFDISDNGYGFDTASKFAVRGLVTQLAYELAPKVRVNGVAPGGTVTGLQALSSLGQESFRLNDVPAIGEEMKSVSPLEIAAMPADHAGAFLYLASRELSPAVTGSIINSDGGLGVRGLTKTRGFVGDA